MTQLYRRIGGVSYLPDDETQPVTLPAGFYEVQNSPHGLLFQRTSPASDDLILVPGTIADDIFEDMSTFLARREAFASYRLTHKRGYLLHGPQGTGKSCLARMIGQKFVDTGGLVFPCDGSGDLTMAVQARRNWEDTRPACFILEDMESWIDNGEVLNILDGGKSLGGVVFLGLTNHLGRLPPRITNRPGRFDRVEKVDHIPEAVQVAFLERIQGRVPGGPDVAADLVRGFKGLPMTPAHLRDAFVAHVLLGTSIPNLRARYDKMFKTAKDDHTRSD